jgi:hypothetical protein
MDDQTTGQASEKGEALIERKLTFRNSTYGGLKSFIRAYKRLTGLDLTNSAAIDYLLRERLARELHAGAFGALLKLSRPEALQVLQAIPSGDSADAQGRTPAASGSGVPTTDAPTPAPSAGAVSINVRVSGPRSFLRQGSA